MIERIRLEQDLKKLKQLTLKIKNDNQNQQQQQQQVENHHSNLPTIELQNNNRDPRLKKLTTQSITNQHYPVNQHPRPHQDSRRRQRSIENYPSKSSPSTIRAHRSRSSRSRDRIAPNASHSQERQEHQQEEEEEGGEEEVESQADSEGPWTEERVAAEQRRYREEMARYYVELEIYERRKREREVYLSSHHHMPPRRFAQRRRDSTEEYFQRSLESVDDSCPRGRRFSLASDRSTLSERRPPSEPCSKHPTIELEQETVEAATVLLGLGLNRPLPHPPQHQHTRSFINEILSASLHLSHSDPASKPTELIHTPRPTGQSPLSTTATNTIVTSLSDHLDRPHSPNQAAISLLRLPLPTHPLPASSASASRPPPANTRALTTEIIHPLDSTRKKQKLLRTSSTVVPSRSTVLPRTL